MRILVCTTEAPLPPVNGFRLQLREVVRRLTRRHEVVVVGPRMPDQDGDGALSGADVRAFPAPSSSRVVRAGRWLRAGRAGIPLAAAELMEPMARAASLALADGSYDMVHVTTAALAGLAPLLGDRPKVLVPLDAWHLNARAATAAASAPLRPARRVEEHRIERFLAHELAPYDRVVTVSDGDADALRALDPRLALEVIPNGVDTAQFAPGPVSAQEPGLVVFLGAMTWPPNQQAAAFLAREVLPVLRARRPDARIALVGRGVGPEVAALGAIDGVEVVGEVPDVRPWLHRAEAFACPMVSGTGIKNKLLEALACGVPTVATPMALGGTAARHGHELLVGDGPREVADRLADLLEDGGLRARLRAGGRAYVERCHDWDAVAARFERLYEEVRTGHRAARR